MYEARPKFPESQIRVPAKSSPRTEPRRYAATPLLRRVSYLLFGGSSSAAWADEKLSVYTGTCSAPAERDMSNVKSKNPYLGPVEAVLHKRSAAC